jgi:hypothetical protein
MRRNLVVAGTILAVVLVIMVGTTCVLAPASQQPTARPPAAFSPNPAPSRNLPVPTPNPASSPIASASPSIAASPSPILARSTTPTLPQASLPAAASPGAVDWWDLENQPEPDLAQQIDAAYRRYWDVVTQAEFDLDTTHIAEVMTGAELDRERKLIDDLRSQSKAGKTDVEHHSKVMYATTAEAVVYDEYVNHSIFIDAVTKQPLSNERPSKVWKVSYLLKKSDGGWKVIDGVRHQ